MFYVGASIISANPLQYPKVYNEFRRCLLRRFPYALYYKIKNNKIIVCGLFHCARDPRTVFTELGERGKPEISQE